MALEIWTRFRSFCSDRAGSFAPTFALLLVPVVGLIGAALDYSRAANERVMLQRALDTALLAAAQDGTSNWSAVAEGTFRSAYRPKGATTATPSFTAANNTYSGSATGTVQTALLTPLGYASIPIAASAAALVREPQAETSCFLSLGKGFGIDDNSMVFSGAPNVKLTGCALRSNTSMKCNGHDTGALASTSAGTTTSCSNPVSGARQISDIYAPIAAHITRKCTASASNITWRPGQPPSSSKMVTVELADRVEYHVCGDLTVSGTGSLTGTAPTRDTVIVIENGSLTVAANAALTAARITIAFTGNNGSASGINFPNGNGHSASLSLSPPTTVTNPFAGISVYQDPALTYRPDSDWGPGATFSSDGVVYMPNARLSLGGNATSGSAGCTKIVANMITMGGAVDVKQSPAACDSLRVKQWSMPRGVVLAH
jgi:hypothetical protein